ncbi:MAG: histidine triad nucleotide-binding protein [Aeromicrobium sp.]|nr:histidine triad nucleotide-binding protein [Burkholderiales bacterium]
MTENPTIFGKIINGEIPCKKVYEDNEVLAFHDTSPAAEVHFLIIPKKHIPTLADVVASDTELLGKMLSLVPVLAAEQGLTAGFRTAINTGKQGGQEVYHLHIHVFGNRPGGEPLRAIAGKI